jgi:adenosine deaminase
MPVGAKTQKMEFSPQPTILQVLNSVKKGNLYFQEALIGEKGYEESLAFFSSAEPYTAGVRVKAVLISRKGKNDFEAKLDKAFLKPLAIEKQIESFFKQIPKTEIHLHVEGCVRRTSLLKLAKRAKSKKIKTISDVDRIFSFSNLTEFINVFIAIQDSVEKVSDFSVLLDDLCFYLKTNNIIYSEIFLAISKFMLKGFSYPDMIDLFNKKIAEIEKKDGIVIRLLVDVGRTFGPQSAKENLDRVLAYPHKNVIGIGLGGNEKIGPAKFFKDTFRLAASKKLHVVAHAGEDVGPESMWAALKDLKAERIGHGMAAIEDEKLMKFLVKAKTPLEICLTSNVFTGKYTKSLNTHPVQTFAPLGINVTVNSDDPTFFNTDLSKEYFYFHKHLNFSVSDILGFVENGVLSSFHPKKKELWKKMSKDIDALKKKFPLIVF